MLDYLYNPEFWELELTWRSISRKMLLLPILVAVLLGRTRNATHLKIIWFSGYSLIMEHLSSDIDLQNLFDENTNSPWYHLLTPLLFLLLTRFFSSYLDYGKYKYWAWLLPLLFTVVVALNVFFGGGFYVFPSLVVALYSTLGIGLSLGYFLYLLRSLPGYYIEKYPMFWVAAGFLIYYSANFLLWIGLNYLNYSRDFFFSIYRINYIVTVVLYSFFTIAICLKPLTVNNKTDNLKQQNK